MARQSFQLSFGSESADAESATTDMGDRLHLDCRRDKLPSWMAEDAGLAARPAPVVLVVIGIALAVAAVAKFRREGTELNPISTTNTKLVLTGPFSLTRNPMYLSLVIITFGIASWVGAWPMFLAPIATLVTANWVHIPFEEDRCAGSSAKRSMPMHAKSGGGYKTGRSDCRTPISGLTRCFPLVCYEVSQSESRRLCSCQYGRPKR